MSKKKSVKIVLTNKNPVKQIETIIKPIVLGSFKNLAFRYPNNADNTIMTAQISKIWRCMMTFLVVRARWSDCQVTVQIEQGGFKNLPSFQDLCQFFD